MEGGGGRVGRGGGGKVGRVERKGWKGGEGGLEGWGGRVERVGREGWKGGKGGWLQYNGALMNSYNDILVIRQTSACIFVCLCTYVCGCVLVCVSIFMRLLVCVFCGWLFVNHFAHHIFNFIIFLVYLYKLINFLVY